MLPYRSDKQVVQGIDVTLVDVTRLKRTERDLRTVREQLAGDLRR